MRLKQLIKLARPGHWIKNIIVFMPIVFSMHIKDIQPWEQAFTAFLTFCFASAFAYILNDIHDRDSDKAHPLKKNRPVASGEVGIGTAIIEAAIFLAAAIAVSLSLSYLLFAVVGVYILLQVVYTFGLKHKALLDVICIALGFVIRTFSGVLAIREEISPWLFICIFTICLFMGFCKRYNETITINDTEDAHNHRPTLIAYTPDLLTHLITLSAGIAVISFLLYGLSDSTIERFGNNYFVYTLPLVVYAVFRFAMLSMKGAYSDPTDLILRDRPFQAVTVLWIISALVIIYFGKDIHLWIEKFY